MAKKILKHKIIIIASLLLVILILPLLFIKGERYPVKEIKVNNAESITLDIAYIKKWNEKEIYEQFSFYKDYTSTSQAIGTDDIGKYIEETKLQGYDEYNPKTSHGTFAEVYEIKNINKECAVALKFPGFNDFYVYINHMYRPENLGQFINDLNLMENISFGTIYHDYFEGNNNRSFEFYGITKEDVWNYLFKDNLDAKNVHSDINWYVPAMSISTNVNILGLNNISLAVTEDGYLTTNILATGKTFYIGEEKVNTFMEFVKNELEGVETVYVYEEDNSEPEQSDTVSQIISYDVETGKETVIDLEITDSSETEASTESYSPPYIPN